MADQSFSDVDLELVLFRLTRYAQGLVAAPRVLGVEPVDIAFPGGESPEDLAMGLMQKLVDPQDTTVKWSEERGRPTTEGVLALLVKALYHDYLDLKKSKRYKTTVYADDRNGEDGSQGLTLNQLAVYLETPEGRLLKKERVERLVAEFSDDAAAQEILELQLDADGYHYNAFTNQELAQLLDTTVADIENRKKRIKNRLLSIKRRETGGKKTDA